MAGFSHLSLRNDTVMFGGQQAVAPLELCPDMRGFCPQVESHDRLAVLYAAIEAGIFKPAAQCVFLEVEPGSRQMENLACLLKGLSGPALVNKMLQLLETVLVPFGFSPSPLYNQEMQDLASRPNPATIDEVIAAWVRQCLSAQALPLRCLSVFDGKLHIRHPSTPKYLPGELIDSGEYGVVYHCTQLLPDGRQRPCAIKIMDVQRIAGKGDSSLRSVDDFLGRLDREFLIPSFIRHPGIVAYVDHLSVQPRLGKPSMNSQAGFAGAKKYLVMELAPPDLFREIEAGLSAAEMRSAVAQVGRALLYMHRLDPGIAHRDIKPENLAFCRQPDGAVLCQIFDFGMARLIGNTLSQRGVTQCGTVQYLAPEILGRQSHDTRVDDFSLGLTIAVIVGNTVPRRGRRGGLEPLHFTCTVVQYSDLNEPIFCCDGQGRPQFKMLDEQGRWVPRPCNGGQWWGNKFAEADAGLPDGSGSVRDIICGLCHEDPLQRMSLIDAMRHPWFGEHALTPAQLAEIDVMCTETNARRIAALGGAGAMDVASDEGEALLQMYGLLPASDA